MTPTELRARIYRVIDRVIATGEPCEIVRGKHRVMLALVPEERCKSNARGPNAGLFEKLAKLPRRDAFKGTDKELAALSAWDEEAQKEWEEEWKAFPKP